jgi:uncharacterized membrane protein YecN with MAPEG domain
MDSLRTMQAMGLTLPSPAYLLGAIFFGLVGLVAWRWGKVRENQRVRWLGVVLMFYPYAVTNTALLYVIGLALCCGLYVAGRD